MSDMERKLRNRPGKIHREGIRVASPRILSKEAAEKALPAPLPPPGAKRREVQARRQDVLDEQADKLSKHIDVISTEKLDALTPRELLRRIKATGILVVSNRRRGMRFLWSQFRGKSSALLTKRLALGWKIVGGKGDEDARESIEHKDRATGYRIIGDELLLLYMPLRRWEAFQAIQREDAMERQGYTKLENRDDPEENERNVTDRLRDIVQASKGGVKVIQFNDYSDDRLGATFVRGIKQERLDGMIRRGGLPGVQPGQSL